MTAEVRWLCERVAKDGGCLCAPAHAIPTDVPPENIAAIFETLRGQAAPGEPLGTGRNNETTASLRRGAPAQLAPLYSASDTSTR